MKFFLLLALAIFSMVGRTAVASPCQSPGQNETVLEAGAEGLGAGEWCELTGAQPPDEFLGTTSSSGEPNTLFEYAHGGQWDPVNGLFVIVGYGYGPGATIRCATIVYKKTTNEWMTFDSEPVGCTGNGHAYDQTVVDPVTGYVYFTPRLNNAVYRGIWSDSTEEYSWSGSVVSGIDQGCVNTGGEEAMGLAWDSSRNGIVLFTDAGGGTSCFWNKSTNTWSVDDGGLPVDGSYHHVAEYNPVREVTWMQDYGTKIHYRNDGGTLTALSTSGPPFSLGCCGSSGRHSTVDPASGKFVVVSADFSDPSKNQWYEYEIENDTWSPINQSMPPFYAEGAAAPISDYGVIMYVDYKFGTSKVYLYKHGVIVPSVPPGSLKTE